MGIKPARGSQSPDLIQEADTHHEWTDEIIQKLITVRQPDYVPETSPSSPVTSQKLEGATASLDAIFVGAINDCLDQIDGRILSSALSAFAVNPKSVPPELDRQTLGRIKAALSRDLDDNERQAYRARFRAILADM